MINNFDCIDKNATKNNARQVLKSYRGWQRITGNALSLFNTPERSNEVNRSDPRLVEYLTAKDNTEKVLTALNLLTKRSRKILHLSYCEVEYYTNYEISHHIDYSYKSLDRLKSKALLEFAEAYSNGELLVYN